MGKMTMPATLPCPTFEPDGSSVSADSRPSFGPPTLSQYIASEVGRANFRVPVSETYSPNGSYHSSGDIYRSDSGYLGLAVGFGLGSSF